MVCLYIYLVLQNITLSRRVLFLFLVLLLSLSIIGSTGCRVLCRVQIGRDHAALFACQRGGQKLYLLFTISFLSPLQPDTAWPGASRLLLLHGAGVPRWSRLLRQRGAGLRDFTAAKAAEVDHDAVDKACCQRPALDVSKSLMNA